MLRKFITKTAWKWGRSLSRYRGRYAVDTMHAAAYAFRQGLDNLNFNIKRNGELRVLKLLKRIDPRCAFDVGANTGEWSLLLNRLYPECVVHAFEIVPSTYAELVAATRHGTGIVANNIGLSDRNGTIQISMGKGSSVATACKIEGMRFHDDYYDRQIECEVRCASDYLQEHGIESIDFLKIDVEGMDLKVIKGFGDQLGRARMIQFEYGIFNIASHDLLVDFCRHLGEQGFVVGKIFPRHVDFFTYHHDMENFCGSNYLAVRSDEQDLIARLGNRRVRH